MFLVKIWMVKNLVCIMGELAAALSRTTKNIFAKNWPVPYLKFSPFFSFIVIIITEKVLTVVFVFTLIHFISPNIKSLFKRVLFFLFKSQDLKNLFTSLVSISIDYCFDHEKTKIRK